MRLLYGSVTLFQPPGFVLLASLQVLPLHLQIVAESFLRFAGQLMLRHDLLHGTLLLLKYLPLLLVLFAERLHLLIAERGRGDPPHG